ncbi:hypothetical protein GMDG_02805 [Pseudogymnoascus destructans 20631-21]|uniref:Uncharacterized protein n=1 Tax=Pseudogymnoascus destructans (strain ATCC MYA-4855 / 20631-21) TaxID=658429 RepID=L8G7F3_PSED2|nr:hypothetical protein GMDG_02805 [Pseudogymnoascus destructans 20631-21]
MTTRQTTAAATAAVPSKDIPSQIAHLEAQIQEVKDLLVTLTAAQTRILSTPPVDAPIPTFAIKLKSKLGNLLLKPTSHYTYFGLSHQQQEQYYSTIATTIYDSLHVIAP